MNNYGHIIKFERIRQNKTQGDLADGICTPSYLSKIESNSILPSDKIKLSLCTKLQINLITEGKQTFRKDLEDLYFEGVINKDRSYIKKQLSIFNKGYYLLAEENYYTNILKIIRLTLVAQDIKNDTPSLIKALTQLKNNNFNDYQSFLYYSILGSFYSLMQEYSLSFFSFQSATQYKNLITIKTWELADFHYLLGHSYLTQQQWLKSSEYIEHALKYFENEFHTIRTIECYLLLSLAQENSYLLKNAFENLLLADKLAVQFNITKYLPSIKQNLGAVATKKGDAHAAIKYYIQSYECKSENEIDDEKLYPVYSLIKEYSRLKKYEESKHWAIVGLSIIEASRNPMNHQRFKHHFNIYFYKETNSPILENKIKEAYEFFLKSSDERHCSKYALLLGNIYLKQKKYKKSVSFFELAKQHNLRLNNLEHIEDL